MILASGCFWNSSRTCCTAQRMISCFDAFISNNRRIWSFIASILSYSPSVIKKVSLMVGLSLILNNNSCCATCTGPVSRIPDFPEFRSSGIPESWFPGFPEFRLSGFPEFRVPGVFRFLRWDYGGSLLLGRRSKELLV